MAQSTFDSLRYADLMSLKANQLAAHPMLRDLPAGLVQNLRAQLDSMRLLSCVNSKLSIVVRGSLTAEQFRELEEVQQFSVQNDGQAINLASQSAGVGASTRIGILMANPSVSPARTMWQPHAPTDGSVQVRLQFRLMHQRRRRDSTYVMEVPSFREITSLAAMLSTYTLEPEVMRRSETWTPMVA